ncbi:MAG: hypothetical protein FD126_142 [Elusimicrobia bacterium]|nr:MAG: hypothetical protein FD126_142 [Elusimicrobiota bacterium]
MSERTRLEMERDAATRKELVTPAPPVFVPKAQGRKLEIALIPQKSMIRQGERFWYRAEIRNVGTVPVKITDSFIDSGSGGDGWSKFRLVISPSTPQPALWVDAGEPCMFEHPPVPGWERMSESEREAASKQWAREQAFPKRHINVLLAPGETIRTRDWQAVSREDSCTAWKTGKPAPERPGGLFREFEDSKQFARPGSYTLKLVLDSPPLPPPERAEVEELRRKGFDAATIQRHFASLSSYSLGHAESPEVKVEVAP